MAARRSRPAHDEHVSFVDDFGDDFVTGIV
jgi:hypothetical protein